MEEPEYDRVTQASLNGIYEKARELDRGHNDEPAPPFEPPGAGGDARADAVARASDASTHASDAPALHGDGMTAACADVLVRDAAAHACEGALCAGETAANANDAESHVSRQKAAGGL